ncbi:DUF6978 family protein [Glaesserella parasuis]
MVRLDIEGPPHRNPDGEEIICPHIHLSTVKATATNGLIRCLMN